MLHRWVSIRNRGDAYVLSCILTFVVCLSNFYELFLLKLPLRVCWSMLAVALLPERTCRSIAALGLLPLRTCRSVAAVTWLPLISYRGAAAGMLSPLPECYLRWRNASPPLVERRRNASPPPVECRHGHRRGFGCFEFVIEFHIRLDYVC